MGGAARVRTRTLPAADVEALADVRGFVREAAGELGASRQAVSDLVQAVDEAACNVVLYGYHGRPGPLEVSLARRGGAIEVVLRDEAPAFDPTTAPPAAPGATTARWGHSGMGIHLLRTMMDEVHHRARPEGGNELTLVREVHRPGEED
ncbi:MAG TPA: ATP-binding protein [Candidatus Limnocylindrales bacterium]|nr:ATP-binding protein [Candidatus Limnocylindrales bacterium]